MLTIDSQQHRGQATQNATLPSYSEIDLGRGQDIGERAICPAPRRRKAVRKMAGPRVGPVPGERVAI